MLLSKRLYILEGICQVQKLIAWRAKGCYLFKHMRKVKTSGRLITTLSRFRPSDLPAGLRWNVHMAACCVEQFAGRCTSGMDSKVIESTATMAWPLRTAKLPEMRHVCNLQLMVPRPSSANQRSPSFFEPCSPPCRATVLALLSGCGGSRQAACACLGIGEALLACARHMPHSVVILGLGTNRHILDQTVAMSQRC